MDGARSLFREYSDSLNVDLDFQQFERELASLPGKYRPPAGQLFVALADGRPVGCVAVRVYRGRTAELKRLFVRRTRRGTGLGRRLALRAVRFARTAGYRAIRLDTLPSMRVAQRLYAAMGFRPIRAYRFNPVPGTSFWELSLGQFPRRAEVSPSRPRPVRSNEK